MYCRCAALPKITNVTFGMRKPTNKNLKQSGILKLPISIDLEAAGTLLYVKQASLFFLERLKYSVTAVLILLTKELQYFRYGKVVDRKGEYRLFTTHVPLLRTKLCPCYITKWDTKTYKPSKVASTGDEILCSLAVRYQAFVCVFATCKQK